MTQSDIQVEEKVKITLKEPSKWAVVYLNDEQTPITRIAKEHGAAVICSRSIRRGSYLTHF